MSDTATMEAKVTVQVTVEDLARMFCNMDDDAQAKFFCECAEIARDNWGIFRAGQQWFLVGKHLATCGCSTYEGREMVNDIASAMREDWSREIATEKAEAEAKRAAITKAREAAGVRSADTPPWPPLVDPTPNRE